MTDNVLRGDFRLERIIWFYWDQGWDAAPWFIKLNYLSWKIRNPQWKILFLDNLNVPEYSSASQIVEPNKNWITITAFSDVLRLDLLARFGGAWVDATLLCMTSLESWLPATTSASGFFSFRSGCIDRDLASWHIAAHSQNYLVCEWLELTKWYWGTNIFDHPEPRWPLLAELERKYCVSREATDGFFNEETLTVKKVYPYFWINYLHQKLVRQDPIAADIWDRTPYANCGPQSVFLSNDPLAPLNNHIDKYASDPNVRMFKFDRRAMPEKIPAGSALDVLYRPWTEYEMPDASSVMKA